MFDAALALPDIDVLLLAAAVADYARAPGSTANVRRSKQHGRSRWRRPRDVARALPASGNARARCWVAFGAEHGEAGLERKRGDARVEEWRISSSSTTSGETGIGFDSLDNEVVLDHPRRSERHVSRARKEERSPRRSSTRCRHSSTPASESGRPTRQPGIVESRRGDRARSSRPPRGRRRRRRGDSTTGFAQKIAKLRVFRRADEGKFDRSLLDVGGSALRRQPVHAPGG